ncbi:hypothetical protein QJU89_03310 [Pasteurella skyensis]|uniref:Uncharacterized protein n=1 Tax=Phocoenobacter skyensis TaxID=97481 RepID=A0AAJ6NAL8_9PAST|nr:hypothetical protein [Pasteurella skyensis]MDP8163263.1 hypothetical protein [Pasteurella skyensis]MDP8173270.1 hypothetical protein [Pasteurella skyensis]MDP8176923.1 hypothetical protein [Pasteurella skyensis]MDP8179680.1 hypothetical protein [Pasteurella skyensis]MDP8182727.1 hypothetical protein [Pasteurella skyensis]
MNLEKYPDSYLFETHSKNEIKRWNRSLKYGFFKRAWGGHAGDGDQFGVWFKYKTKIELIYILKAIGIKLKIIPPNNPKLVKEQLYTFEEYQKFKNNIPDLPEFEQPGWITINSIPCYINISNGIICINFFGACGKMYEVCEEDFENCLKFEDIITDMNLIKYVSTDYEKSIMYISKKQYPELFD